MKKLIAFDLDGTLSQHKTPIDDVNRGVLTELSKKYRLLMLGAGACRRIYDQLRQFPIDIVGSYGMQQSVVTDGRFIVVRDESYTVDHEYFNATVASLRKKLSLNFYYGDSVEFHASGLVTFPILGTAAPLSEKLAYDPDRSKRRAMYNTVKNAFPDFNVFIGGSSSYDISKKQFNKFFALKRYCDENSIALSDALFVGDDFGDGGNDSAIRLGGVDYVEVEWYEHFPDKVAFLL